MNGNVVLALVILGWLLVGCVFMVIDVSEECRYQSELAEQEAHLAALWDDEATA